MSINVFSGFYTESNRDRRLELETCLYKNYKNKNINFIVLESQDRLKFNDFFSGIRSYGGKDDINIICNSDIYFDDTILLTQKILDNQVYALNRWAVHPNGDCIHYDMLGSSDAWVFRGIPENINGDFYLGYWGCDGRLGHEIVKAGYELLNPSLSIRVLHLHLANIRNYNALINKVPGPYVGAPACYLDDPKPAGTFMAVPFETPNNYNVSKYKFVFFYNNWHKGDLHVSRGFVKSIIEEIKPGNPKMDFYYGHYNEPNILSDLPAKYDNRYLEFLKGEMHTPYFERDGGVFINTWYGVEHYKHYNLFGISFDCLYEVLKTPAKAVQVDLDKIDVKRLFPDIRFNAYGVQAINVSFMRDKINVLISNGPVHSGQTHNYSMNPLIKRLAESFAGVNFLVTNVEVAKVQLSNVFYTGDIIGKKGCDLNENAYLSTLCQIIVGRCSGVYTFALNRTNLFDRDCNIMCFSDYPDQLGDYWLGKKFAGKIGFRGKSDNYRTQNLNVIFDKIAKKIREIIK